MKMAIDIGDRRHLVSDLRQLPRRFDQALAG